MQDSKLSDFDLFFLDIKASEQHPPLEFSIFEAEMGLSKPLEYTIFCSIFFLSLTLRYDMLKCQTLRKSKQEFRIF